MQVDLIDETFLVASPEAVAAVIHDPAVTARWWPDLALTVFQDRGVDGIRWTCTGGLVGTAEVWCERMGDGVLLHVYIRADVTRRGSTTEARELSRRGRDRARAKRAREIKQWSWRLKDSFDVGRRAGEPRPGVLLEEIAATAEAPVAAGPEGAVDAPGKRA